MEFIKVDKSNIETLYDLNTQLAKDEGQSSLFTATRKNYFDAFLGDHSISFGYLSFINKEVVGFYVYYFKFASYQGSRALYVEDIYLTSECRTNENKSELLKHTIRQSEDENCSRIEMRVLKLFNFGYDMIKETGFKQITKWDVYRIEHDH